MKEEILAEVLFFACIFISLLSIFNNKLTYRFHTIDNSNRLRTCSSNLQHNICKSEHLSLQTHETCLTLESRKFPHLLSAKILTSGKFTFSVFWDVALRSRWRSTDVSVVTTAFAIMGSYRHENINNFQQVIQPDS